MAPTDNPLDIHQVFYYDFPKPNAPLPFWSAVPGTNDEVCFEPGMEKSWQLDKPELRQIVEKEMERHIEQAYEIK